MNQEFPFGGPLLGIEDLMADLKLARRQVEKLIELGEIQSFKMGKLRRTTQAARDAYVQRLIAEEQQRLEDLTG